MKPSFASLAALLSTSAVKALPAPPLLPQEPATLSDIPVLTKWEGVVGHIDEVIHRIIQSEEWRSSGRLNDDEIHRLHLSDLEAVMGVLNETVGEVSKMGESREPLLVGNGSPEERKALQKTLEGLLTQVAEDLKDTLSAVTAEFGEPAEFQKDTEHASLSHSQPLERRAAPAKELEAYSNNVARAVDYGYTLAETLGALGKMITDVMLSVENAKAMRDTHKAGAKVEERENDS